MRKWITIAVLVALLSALVLTANGTQSRLNAQDVQVKPGETVYVKLELTQSTVGDSVGVAYTYDKSVLKPLESSCTWARKGLLQDFDTKKGAGVWADVVAADMKGLVCTLAFEVISKEAHFDTSVSCTLIVKNGAKTVGTYTAEAEVSTYCDHRYGAWRDNGILGHIRTCSACNRSEGQTHKWDNGTTVPIPNRPGMDVTTFTCKDCGATKKFEHISSNKPTVPEETVPPQTQPEETTRPTNPGGNQGGGTDHTHPTQPDVTTPTTPGGSQGGSSGGNQGGNQGGSSGGNQGGNQGSTNKPGTEDPTKPSDDHGDSHLPGFDGGNANPTFPTIYEPPTIPTMPDDDHGHDHDQSPFPTVGDDHDHDHSSNPVVPVVDSKTKTRNMLVFLGTLAVLGGAAYFFLKKKRR